MDDEIKALLLGSIEANRLAMLAGAGLSMGPPTKLPNAADVAASCARKYEAATGVQLDEEAHRELERLAVILYGRDQLRSFLIRRLVEWEPFRDNPNPAHKAVADLLLCSGLEAVVSTNYDTHIESAAALLGEKDFQYGLDGDQLDTAGRYSPLLKLHGCCVIDRDNTVWLEEQTEEEEIAGRLERTRIWARAALRNRDLLFVGFWSDWSYLNAILQSVLQIVSGAEQRHVFLVDPAAADDLAAKAPDLWKWVNETEGIRFRHIEAYSEAFLDELRLEVSRKFMRQAWASAQEAYRRLAGVEPGPPRDCSGYTDTTLLYQLRRDMTGVGPLGAVKTLRVDELQVLAAVQRRLLDLGATLEGFVFCLGDRTFRVVYTPARLMGEVKRIFERGTEASVIVPGTVDAMICVGAIPDPTPADITRPERNPSIVRPKVASRWITVDQISDLLRGEV